MHFFKEKTKKVAEKFGGVENCLYLCNRLRKVRALSSAGLEHLPYKQRVGGSNPSTPTRKGLSTKVGRPFSCLLSIFIIIFSRIS